MWKSCASLGCASWRSARLSTYARYSTLSIALQTQCNSVFPRLKSLPVVPILFSSVATSYDYTASYPNLEVENK